jgi:hypothetical protein
VLAQPLRSSSERRDFLLVDEPKFKAMSDEALMLSGRD